VFGEITLLNILFKDNFKIFVLQTEIYFLICRVLTYVPYLPSKGVTKFHVSFQLSTVQGHTICWRLYSLSLTKPATQLQTEVPEILGT
jgi:hypothetical protein